MSSQSSFQTPGKIKRKLGDTDLTLDKMPFKIVRPMEDEEFFLVLDIFQNHMNKHHK
jgi:hypothetical protein